MKSYFIYVILFVMYFGCFVNPVNAKAPDINKIANFFTTIFAYCGNKYGVVSKDEAIREVTEVLKKKGYKGAIIKKGVGECKEGYEVMELLHKKLKSDKDRRKMFKKFIKTKRKHLKVWLKDASKKR